MYICIWKDRWVRIFDWGLWFPELVNAYKKKGWRRDRMLRVWEKNNNREGVLSVIVYLFIFWLDWYIDEYYSDYEEIKSDYGRAAMRYSNN